MAGDYVINQVHVALQTMYGVATDTPEIYPTNDELAHAYNVLAEYIGSDARVRVCDDCSFVESASNAPDWPNGRCPECGWKNAQ